MQMFGTLVLVPALQHLDLLAEPVRDALLSWEPAVEVSVARIDPAFADTAAMSQGYDVPLEASANCVVVMGRREGQERTAACMVRADTRADVNNVVKRVLDVRKASFLDHGRAVTQTAMEYGGITPLGLPPDWRLFVDASLIDVQTAIIGSGIRGSKLILPGRLLGLLPGAEVIKGLAR